MTGPTGPVVVVVSGGAAATAEIPPVPDDPLVDESNGIPTFPLVRGVVAGIVVFGDRGIGVPVFEETPGATDAGMVGVCGVLVQGCQIIRMSPRTAIVA